jgi:hypothetical protein
VLHHFLEKEDLSYLIGFLQSDGHHSSSTRNRGKIRVELQQSDRGLLEDLQRLLPGYSSIIDRVRDTNFIQDYHSSVWTFYSQEIRQELLSLGVPCGNKSRVIRPPAFNFSPRDYFRGLIDGDGSLGYTKNGWPFVSLTLSSDAVAMAYVSFIRETTSKTKLANRNQRDQVYNLMVQKEDAQTLAQILYSNCRLRLERKHQAYVEIMKWVRPEDMVRKTARRWLKEEEVYLVSHTDAEASAYLQRSLASIQMRRYRLQGRYPYRRFVV